MSIPKKFAISFDTTAAMQIKNCCISILRRMNSKGVDECSKDLEIQIKRCVNFEKPIL